MSGVSENTTSCLRAAGFLLTSLAMVAASLAHQPTEGPLGGRPIIGLVFQPHPRLMNYGHYYAFANYQSFIEQSGGGVVPIFTDQEESYYDELMSRLNGVLIPGGVQHLSNSSYANLTDYILEKARRMNDAGNYFPVYGICRGIQQMAAWPLGYPEDLVTNVTGAEDVSLPLKFTREARQSKMYGDMSAELWHMASAENLGPHFHRRALTYETYQSYKQISDFFMVTSVNDDDNGLTFVSSLEAWDYPFYATQWHPEKIGYWFIYGTNINHSHHAMLLAQYMSNFFVNEARKSKQSFKSAAELSRFIIYNYPILYKPETNLVSYYTNTTRMPDFDA